MNVQVINIAGIQRIAANLWALPLIDFTPLMEEWEQIMVEDNRRGVLMGRDKHDALAPALRYRLGGGARKVAIRTGVDFGTTAKGFKGLSDPERGGRANRFGVQRSFSNAAWYQRSLSGVHVQTKGLIQGAYTQPVLPRTPRKASGKARNPNTGAIVLPNNNLATAAYKRLTGPRLAPRREASRVISNYHTRSGRTSAYWFAEGVWVDVVDVNGEPFLQYHFNGVGQSRYDLRGVRAWGMEEARAALRRFVKGHVSRVAAGATFATGYRQFRAEGMP